METELIKHQCNSSLKPQLSLGIVGILRESFKTINRNRKLLFLVLVLVLLVFSQLQFAEIYLLEPVAKDFSLQSTNHPEMLQDISNNMNRAIYSVALNDIRNISLVKLSILTFEGIMNLVFLIATVSSSSKAYTAKLQDPKEMISIIIKSWEKLSNTYSRLVLINFGLVTLCFLSLGIVSFLDSGSWGLYLFYGVLFLSIPALFFYVSALWMLSMVVSVLEDVGGLDAIVRAKQLIKGKRIQASLIMVLVVIVYGLVRLMTGALPSYNLGKWSQLAVTVPFGNGMICMFKLFMFVVLTVYYHERKVSCEEKEGNDIYVPIVAGEVWYHGLSSLL